MSETRMAIYTAGNGNIHVEVQLENGNMWATQAMMAQIFGVQRPAITRHLRNIFLSGELDETSVCSILEHTAPDGKTYATKFYNLDAIISLNGRELLQHAGRISHEMAEECSRAQLDVLRERLRHEEQQLSLAELENDFFSMEKCLHKD